MVNLFDRGTFYFVCLHYFLIIAFNYNLSAKVW